MTEEEKKAIEYIKEFQKELYGASSKNLMAHYLDIVLNLIDKQQKEIEELKQITMLYNSYEIPSASERKIVIADTEYFAKGYFVENYIKKDKIRELIKKYSEKEECTYNELIDFVKDIKDLLED